jgi:hypothetical protein
MTALCRPTSSSEWTRLMTWTPSTSRASAAPVASSLPVAVSCVSIAEIRAAILPW